MRRQLFVRPVDPLARNGPPNPRRSSSCPEPRSPYCHRSNPTSPYGPSPTIPATGSVSLRRRCNCSRPTSRRTAPFRRALPFSDRRCEASSPKNRRMSSRLLDAVDASSGSASSSTDRTARNNGCSRTLPAYSPRTPPTAAATSALGDASAPRGCGHSPDPAVRQTSPAAETALPPAPRRSAPQGAASSDHPSSPWPGTHSPFQPPREVPLRSCGE